MPWDLLLMKGPLFDGDVLYNTICILILVVVGGGMLAKTESRIGWLFFVAAAVWAYLTYQDFISM
jgi:hypothetical protein